MSAVLQAPLAFLVTAIVAPAYGATVSITNLDPFMD